MIQSSSKPSESRGIMATIKTSKSKYTIADIQFAESGKVTVVVRQPSNKRRILTRRDVGSARWYPAIQSFLAEKAARADQTSVR
jgi:hypothetical protein